MYGCCEALARSFLRHMQWRVEKTAGHAKK